MVRVFYTRLELQYYLNIVWIRYSCSEVTRYEIVELLAHCNRHTCPLLSVVLHNIVSQKL